MKHVMIYEDFSVQKKADEILDKISKYGIKSVTKHEKEFLDAFSINLSGKNNKPDIFTKMSKIDSDICFEDDCFKFELSRTKNDGDEIHYLGTLYVPDLEVNGININGNLVGKIIVYHNGTYSIEFEKVDKLNGKKVIYDVYDFCEGLEYELDNFIDTVIQELA